MILTSSLQKEAIGTPRGHTELEIATLFGNTEINLSYFNIPLRQTVYISFE